MSKSGTLTHDLGNLECHISDVEVIQCEGVRLHWWFSTRANQYVLEMSMIDKNDGYRWEPALISLVGSGWVPPQYDPARHCFIKNYSEYQGIPEMLEKAGAIRDTGVSTLAGFARLPLVEVLFVPEEEQQCCAY